MLKERERERYSEEAKEEAAAAAQNIYIYIYMYYIGVIVYFAITFLPQMLRFYSARFQNPLSPLPPLFRIHPPGAEG